MSTTAIAPSPDDFPTETIPAVPVRRPILRPVEGAPFSGWRDQAPTEELGAVPASLRRSPALHRISAPHRSPGRTLRHLRAALTGIALAVALLTGLQLYAAAGISGARQAALAERDAQAALVEQAAPAAPAQPGPAQTEQPEQADAPTSQWLIEGTATVAPSPLDLPRCTTSPDTPLPCLATISPSQDRAVVLEEDASLTALVRR